MIRLRAAVTVAVLVVMTPAGWGEDLEGKAEVTHYLDSVRHCLDTLMTEGTDRYGGEHSPMFSSILDLKTHELPVDPPSLLHGQRAQDRAFPGGNLQHDLHTLLVLKHFSGITGEARYEQAASSYLEYFLRRCAPVGNGLFPCGEHAFWDFRRDTIGGPPIQEDLGFMPQEFLDMLWDANPQAVTNHIRGLERHLLEGDRWTWNRHASILRDQRPKEPAAFPRHGGFYVYQWVYLYTKTSDPELLEWARKTSISPGGIDHSVMSLGLSLLRANELLGPNRLPEFEERGRKYLAPLVEDQRNSPRLGITGMYLALAKAEHPEAGRTYGFWDIEYAGSGGYGSVGAERLAIMCLCAHRLTGSEKHLQFARDVCDFYISHPRPKNDGITPGKFAGLIALMLDLHDLTGEEKYLTHSREMADEAISLLFVDGLFRAATGEDYYEAANGAGLLMMELLRLHLAVSGSDYPLPRSYNNT